MPESAGGSGKRFHEPGQITRIVDMAVDVGVAVAHGPLLRRVQRHGNPQPP